jgi:hypothetical protein
MSELARARLTPASPTQAESMAGGSTQAESMAGGST